MIKLIAGLGNPGAKYARTRHNFGFRAIDRLLEVSRPTNTRATESAALFETEEFGLLCKPYTYMNRSGSALASVSRDAGIQPQEILVLYDDFALDLGIIRIRPHGSSGGHNGLQSIIEQFGTTHIPRVRLGIQTDEMENWSDFVLSNFRKSEETVVEEMLELCCDAVSIIMKEGITAAMNRFNKKQVRE